MKLPREQKLQAVRQLQQYFRDELEQEIGDLPAELLFDFLAGLAGPFYYNEALADARKQLADRLDALTEDLIALERPLPQRGS